MARKSRGLLTIKLWGPPQDDEDDSLLTISSPFKAPEPPAAQKLDKLLATQVQEGPGVLPFKIRATLNLRGNSGQMARALSQTPTLSGLCFPIIKRRLPSSDFLGSYVWPQTKRQVPGSSTPHNGEPALEYTHSEPVYTCMCIAWPGKRVHTHTGGPPGAGASTASHGGGDQG